ncbi:MAG: hypothetical protein WAO23_07755 [Dethiobacteria bacterium]
MWVVDVVDITRHAADMRLALPGNHNGYLFTAAAGWSRGVRAVADPV